MRRPPRLDASWCRQQGARREATYITRATYTVYRQTDTFVKCVERAGGSTDLLNYVLCQNNDSTYEEKDPAARKRQAAQGASPEQVFNVVATNDAIGSHKENAVDQEYLLICESPEEVAGPAAHKRQAARGGSAAKLVEATSTQRSPIRNCC